MAARRLLLIALLTCSTTSLTLAQDLDDAFQRLSQRFGHRPIAVTWQNQSTMPPEEADVVRKHFEAAFEVSPAGIETKATLSENPHGYLIVLQTSDGKVLMESWTRPPAKPLKPPFQLKRSFLGESPRPILDAAVSPDGQTTILLEPFRVTTPDGKSAGLGLPRPLPRDPRGRVKVSDTGEIKVQLPGMHCTGTLRRMQCSSSDDAWIVPGRNYFRGPRGLYYSSVEIEGGVFQSELDGHTRLYLDQTEPARVLENWGSELAPIETTCGTGKPQLVTSLETDQAQAFEFSGEQLKPSTPPLSTDGPVVAMWQAGERRDQVTVVVRNRIKGTYEASRLAISCTQ
jgi:hypothetical protein